MLYLFWAVWGLIGGLIVEGLRNAGRGTTPWSDLPAHQGLRP